MEIYKINVDYVYIGTTPNVIATESNNIGILYKGQEVRGISTQTINQVIMIKLLNGGWIPYKDMNKNVGYVNKLHNAAQPMAGVIDMSTGSLIGDNGERSMLESVSIGTMGSEVLRRTTRLFGAPAQFLPTTDNRPDIEQSTLGRLYATKIASEAPIVSIMPGKPYYLPDTSSNEKDTIEGILGAAYTGADSNPGKTLTEAMGFTDKRYFEFESDYGEYLKYVNFLCRSCAIYLGIENEVMPGSSTTLQNYNWDNYKFRRSGVGGSDSWSSGIDSFIYDIAIDSFSSQSKYVEFYASPASSINESVSSNTEPSMFEGLLQKGSSMAREFNFLGGAMDASVMNLTQETLSELASEISKVGPNGGFVSRLMGTAEHILLGSNVAFPKIWGDTTSGNSHQVTIHLRSPYGNKMSLMLCILAPLMHIIGFSFPRQTSANTYSSPFIVRANSPGWFSCEMGMVTSVSIDKGGQGSWTIHGIPSEVTVSMTIEPLSSNISITTGRDIGLLLNNEPLIEYLGVTCGLMMTDSNSSIKWNYITSAFKNNIMDVPSDAVNTLKDALYNIYANKLDWTLY